MTHEPAGPDLLADLLRAAGRREQPPQEAYRRTFEAAESAWVRTVRKRRRTQIAAWALAASVLAASGTALFVYRAGIEPAPVARLEHVIGALEIRGPDARRLDATGAGASLPRGATLHTAADAGAALMLADGASLRLAADTRIELESARRIRLASGRVYLDTGSQGAAGGIEIATRAGVARDVGTQFEVRYVGDDYRLRVREGRVQLERPGADLATAAGEELRIDATGEVSRAPIARDDAEWQWVEALATAPDFDGQPVAALLAWVERETGRSVRFASPAIARRAASTILHGSVARLAPLEALEVMLATTDLSFAILDNGTILVGARDG